LTTNFGIAAPDELGVSMHNLLSMLTEGAELLTREMYIQCGKCDSGVFDLIPANINLALSEINLRNEVGGEGTLSELLEPLRGSYDYIIIDTNPTIGLLTINALVACDEVIIPVSPQLWSITGLSALVSSIMKVKRKLNSRIEIAGILLTMCDNRTKLYREARELLECFAGSQINVFDSCIPMTTKVGEANYESVSLFELAPENRAAKAYEAFAAEVYGRYEVKENG
jgi:chromosome partitioning protein